MGWFLKSPPGECVDRSSSRKQKSPFQNSSGSSDKEGKNIEKPWRKFLKEIRRKALMIKLRGSSVKSISRKSL